ncbi:MAG: hypothetical protein D6767_04425 [Candidatus Hydrogenedentota bacterium]|nr:MAG: hypothetical protein D6767_04425 [Candidatus Hydrogenedentota bacterium]
MKKLVYLIGVSIIVLGFSSFAFSAECKVTAKACGKAAKQFMKAAKKVKRACKKKNGVIKKEAKCSAALQNWNQKYSAMKGACDSLATDCNPNSGGGTPIDPGL